MKKQQHQQLVRMRTLPDSNDDDDVSSSSSASNGTSSNYSMKITDLMRENERKIRSLSESYMNRMLMVSQQMQPAAPTPNTIALPPLSRALVSRTPSTMQLEMLSTAPALSLNQFNDTLKQLILREERKREKSYLPPDDDPTVGDPYNRLSVGITQCLRDYEGEVCHARRRINDLSEQQEHILNENRHVVRQLTDDFEQNTLSLRQTYEKRLSQQREESSKILYSLENYKVEILTLREAYEKKLRVKDELLNELNERVVKNETEQVARQHALHLKIDHFQQSFETLQARNKQIEQDSQMKIKENHDLLSQISNLQLEVQRLQHAVTAKANNCTELSQKLSLTLPKLAECERFGSELQQWFSLLSPQTNPINVTLVEMSSIVSARIARFDDLMKQHELIDEDLSNARVFEGDRLSDRVRRVIANNAQLEAAHADVSNKYQALLLQTNMLTGIIKQHTTETAHQKANEEQLKDLNQQLLDENQRCKMELQDNRAKLLQITSVNGHLEHECSVGKQHVRDLQVQSETARVENHTLANELQTRRDTIKRLEQELHSMKQLFEATLKEKQIQSDQLAHERQLFQRETDTLKQMVIRDGHDKGTINVLQQDLNTLQYQCNKLHVENETLDDELRRVSNGVRHQIEWFKPVTEHVEQEFHEEEERPVVDTVNRRATSTPTPMIDEKHHPPKLQHLGVTKQINQVLHEMRNLLTSGRQVVVQHQEEMVPERDHPTGESSKSRRSKRELVTVIGIEQH